MSNEPKQELRGRPLPPIMRDELSPLTEEESK